ncbi:MAG: zinc-binding alcohol dehydrogenase, partial [Gemmatimonadaceae bacterium]|nr:zinc-binding alcohol dehydrogenase [Acetobacteraceae bacterium]
NQDGAFPFPVKYGYSVAGVVEEGPDLLVGAAVFCLHPHQTRFTVPARDVVPIPDGVSNHRAVLAPQIETALNATWDAPPRPGDRIAVVGAGVIGCLVAWLCAQVPGCAVQLFDTDPARRQVAERLGIPFMTPGAAVSRGCDLVFHSSASADGLELALDLAGAEATVVELSWYGAGAIPLRLGGAFHSQRLTLRASQVGMIAPERRARWDGRRRLALALSLAADPRLDALVEASTPFDALPAALPAILGRPGALCHRIAYHQDPT